MRRAQKGRLSLGQKGEEGGEGSPVPIITETLPGSENLPVIGLVDVALAPHRRDQIAPTQCVAVTDANRFVQEETGTKVSSLYVEA